MITSIQACIEICGLVYIASSRFLESGLPKGETVFRIVHNKNFVFHSKLSRICGRRLFTMADASDRKLALRTHKVIPDVLTEDLNLSFDLTLKWPEATLDSPGQELDREKTQTEPEVLLNPAPSEPLDNLILIMTDPDLMMNNDTYFGQVRHWLVTNLTANPDGKLSHHASAERSPYVGPAPLPNYLYSRPHRYVFILARAGEKIAVTPEDLRELQQPYMAAVAGKQGEVQDLKDRWGFNAQKLVEKKGLEVQAVTFMRVGGNLKSAGANMGMMGQAMVEKVIGA